MDYRGRFLVLGAIVLGIGATNDSGSSAWAAKEAVGQATIYSDKFDGKKTASGTKFNNPPKHTQHNKLPLGSKVQIKNKKTGKKATVKITDRTAKSTTAAVDLSKGAAKKLGVKGKAPVVAKVVGGKGSSGGSGTH